jgi:hypothetical protein
MTNPRSQEATKISTNLASSAAITSEARENQRKTRRRPGIETPAKKQKLIRQFSGEKPLFENKT